MRIQCPEDEFSGDQKDDRADRRESALAESLALGGLKQSVQGFDETVRHSSARPIHDALKMIPDHARHGFYWFDLRAHNVGAPLL